MLDDSPRTVLVVDDDEVVRDSLSALLQSRGYTVHEYPSGMDFLSRAAGVMPGCLLLDVHMPEMTGLELLKILRAQGNTIPAVVMTGRNDPGILAQAADLGVIAVLEKPASHTVLLPALEQALASRTVRSGG